MFCGVCVWPGWPGDVRNRGLENLDVRIVAVHVCAKAKRWQKKSVETLQNKGFRCIRCFFVCFGGLPSKAFFQKKIGHISLSRSYGGGARNIVLLTVLGGGRGLLGKEC